MKKLIKLLVVGITLLFAGAAFAEDVFVNGYLRSDGTHVNSYHRTSPDSDPWNNYSTKGNYNPYTGQQGHRDPYNW